MQVRSTGTDTHMCATTFSILRRQLRSAKEKSPLTQSGKPLNRMRPQWRRARSLPGAGDGPCNPPNLAACAPRRQGPARTLKIPHRSRRARAPEASCPKERKRIRNCSNSRPGLCDATQTEVLSRRCGRVRRNGGNAPRRLRNQRCRIFYLHRNKRKCGHCVSSAMAPIRTDDAAPPYNPGHL